MNFEVVLVGSDANAYYMARNFHEKYNIKPYVVGRLSQTFTSLSKILKLIIEPKIGDDRYFSEKLVDLAKKINNKNIILIGCSDDYVSLIIKNKKKLEKYYLFNYPEEDLFNKLVDKKQFYSSFKNSILDFPKTYIYDVKENFNIKHINEFQYPIIIKPSNVVEYHNHSFTNQNKVYKVFEQTQIYNIIQAIKDSGYEDSLIFQEYIPGDDSRLFDSVFYCSSQGEIQLQSFGQIGLQEHTKTGIGNLTVVINGYNQFGNTEEIQKELKKFIQDIHYTGVCEFDLKYDERDKKFKVFEINPRQARSSYYLTKCGYNLAEYFVDDLIYKKTKKFRFITDQVVLSFVPMKVIKKYIKNKEYVKKVKELKRKNLYTDPLNYKKDRSLRRQIWLFKRGLNYNKKYKNNNW